MSHMLRYPVTFAHNSWEFGDHLNADGTPNTADVKDTAVLDEAIWLPNFRDQREALHLAQGGTLGRVHKGLLGLRLKGRLRVPDAAYLAELADREREMRAAFDPYQCYLDSVATDGAYALDYSSPTTDTATYANGRIALRRYMRPVSLGLSENLVSHALPYDLTLVAADPREYEQTEQTLVLSASTTSGDALNRGTTSAPVKISIVMDGAGSATCTISDGAHPLPMVLNLQPLASGNTVVITMETGGPYGRGRRILVNGSDSFATKVSGASTWLSKPPGSHTWTIVNAEGIASMTIAWHSARA